jgi:hypothetical protein
MSSRLYGDHFIMAFPSFDTASNGWAPQADITWDHRSPSRKFAFVRFPNRFRTEAEAINFALDMAQAWIDKHPRRLHSYGDRSRRGRVIDVVGALKHELAKGTPNQPRRAQVASEGHLEKSFTFDQFKSAIAERGLKLGEQTLHKSYTALIRLLKSKHLSSAEARRKVEHSQQDFTAAQSAMRRPRAARIPLTERDWRRIG